MARRWSPSGLYAHWLYGLNPDGRSPAATTLWVSTSVIRSVSGEFAAFPWMVLNARSFPSGLRAMRGARRALRPVSEAEEGDDPLAVFRSGSSHAGTRSDNSSRPVTASQT